MVIDAPLFNIGQDVRSPKAAGTDPGRGHVGAYL